jgi:LPXTG-motif cell wall-anchored protein
MSSLNKMSRLFGRAAAGTFALAMVAFGIIPSQARAQDTTITTTRHAEASYDTQVRNAEVVYVEGNDLVLKLEDGKVEHLVVPESDRFTINGSDVTVHELTPGTKLTQTITTTVAPRYVTSVRTLKGKVWHMNAHASTVILTLPDGSNQSYKIPSHAKITVGGQPKTVFDLRKGMKLEATIVTDDEHTVIERSKSVVGEMPAPPATLQEVGVLLFFEPPSLAAPTMVASTEEPVSTLPKTGTTLPWVGLLGALALATSFGMGAIRKAVRA